MCTRITSGTNATALRVHSFSESKTVSETLRYFFTSVYPVLGDLVTVKMIEIIHIVQAKNFAMIHEKKIAPKKVLPIRKSTHLPGSKVEGKINRMNVVYINKRYSSKELCVSPPCYIHYVFWPTSPTMSSIIGREHPC